MFAAGFGFPDSLSANGGATLVICCLAIIGAFFAVVALPFGKRYVPLPGNAQRTLWICFLGALALALVSGFVHDYRAYMSQWGLAILGKDPWLPAFGNAYGPLYNVLAYAYDIQKYLPKLIFVLAWFVSVAFLYRECYRREVDQRLRTVVLGVALSPLFYILVAVYGTFDVLVGAICLLAQWFLLQKRPASAGAALAAAVLLKYYPAVLLPVFLIAAGRRAPRLIAGFAAVVVAVMVPTVAKWGDSFLEPLLFAEDREAKSSSIFKFLDGRYSPLRIFDSPPEISPYSHIVMVIAVLVCLYVIYRLKIQPVVAAPLILLTALTFYRVGHSQFQIPVFFLYLYAFIEVSGRVRPAKTIRAFVVYVAFHNLLVVGYAFTGYLNGSIADGFSGDWEFIRDLSGLPALLLSIWLVVETVRETGFRESAEAAATTK